MNALNIQPSIFDIVSVSKKENVVFAKVNILADSEIYKAHFPGNPITPGVCQLQLVKDCIKTAFQIENFTFEGSKFVKFVNILKPTEHQEIDIEVVVNQNNNTLELDAKIYDKEIIFLKARLNYTLSV